MLAFRKDAVKLLTLRKVAANRKSCPKVAEQNLSRPTVQNPVLAQASTAVSQIRPAKN